MENKKLKIALFHNEAAGGAKRALCEIARVLSNRGHSIDLFTFSCSDESFLPLDKFIQQKFIFDIAKPSYPKFSLYILEAIYKLIIKLIILHKLDKLSKVMATVINRNGYDIAYVDLCRYTHAPFILKYLRIPNVYFCQNPLRNICESELYNNSKNKQNNNSIIRKLYKGLCKSIVGFERSLLIRIDRSNMRSTRDILTNSYYTKEYIYRISGMIAKVIYLGVDTDKFKRLDLQKDSFILSVGRICPQKSFDFIINSLSLIPHEKRPSLVIAGIKENVDTNTYLINLACQKKVRLEIKEAITDEELVKLYNQASIVVFVPLMEPFGLVTLEAMACGTPVIGVKEGGLRESIKDKETGILIDREESRLKEAIELLLEDKELYRVLSKNARDEILDNWTWKESGNRLEKILFKIIEQK